MNRTTGDYRLDSIQYDRMKQLSLMGFSSGYGEVPRCVDSLPATAIRFVSEPGGVGGEESKGRLTSFCTRFTV